MNETINKFDLINNGNMGYRGDKKLLNNVHDMCSNNYCLFIFDKRIGGQLNLFIIEDIIMNNNYIDSKYGYVIYSNIIDK